MKNTAKIMSVFLLLSISFLFFAAKSHATTFCEYRANAATVADLMRSNSYQELRAFNQTLDDSMFADFSVQPGTGLSTRFAKVSSWSIFNRRTEKRRAYLQRQIEKFNSCIGNQNGQATKEKWWGYFYDQTKREKNAWQEQIDFGKKRLEILHSRWGRAKFSPVSASKFVLPKFKQPSLATSGLSGQRTNLIPKIHSSHVSYPYPQGASVYIYNSVLRAHRIVPTPGINIDLYNGNCNGYYVAACAGRVPSPYIWLSSLAVSELDSQLFTDNQLESRTSGRQVLYHELAHQFDYLYLSDRERSRLAIILGFRPGSDWSKKSISNGVSVTPREWFADALGACWSGSETIMNNSYEFPFSSMEVQPLCEAARKAYADQEINNLEPLKEAKYYYSTKQPGRWTSWSSAPMKFSGRWVDIQFDDYRWFDALKSNCAEMLSGQGFSLQLDFCGDRLRIKRTIFKGSGKNSGYLGVTYHGLP